MRKGQTWSMDVMIAISVFIVAIILLYSFIALRSGSDKSASVARDGEILGELFASQQEGNLGFIIGRRVDLPRFLIVANISYHQLKKMLGVRNDFCLYLEDEEGYVIPINDTMFGIGSNRSQIGPYHCGPESGKPS